MVLIAVKEQKGAHTIIDRQALLAMSELESAVHPKLWSNDHNASFLTRLSDLQPSILDLIDAALAQRGLSKEEKFPQ